MTALANGGTGRKVTVPRRPSYSIGSTVDPRVALGAELAVRAKAVEAARLLVIRRCSDEVELANVLGMLGIAVTS
jgi:hypothetical protein